ncbi:hypothetical protein V5F35_21145, partial [Xanthobacter sp. V3B-7B]
FVGSNYADTFISDATAQAFNGGGGTDTIDYSGSASAVNVNLTSGVGSGGDAEGDTYTNIEVVVGSAYADTLSSTTSAGHTLRGGAGNDIYIVGSQSVTITEAAGDGDDEVQSSYSVTSIASFANVERL